MVTEDQARQVATDFINQDDPHWPSKPVMVITGVEEVPLGWLFYWNSSDYLATKDTIHALAGNGPVYVSRATGDFEIVETVPPLRKRIQEAEQRLKRKTETQGDSKG